MRRYSPAEKTAILMVALGEDLASEVFRQMEESEVRRVGAALSGLGRIDQDAIDLVIEEFHEILESNLKDPLKGGFGFTKRVLAKAFSESPYGQDLADSIQKYHVEMRSLEIADADTIARLIRHEHPQTIALVIAHAPAAKSGRILKSMPEAMHTEIISRIANLSEVDPNIIQELDDQLMIEIQKAGMRAKKIGGINKVAAILNSLNGEHQDLLDRLEERDPDLSTQIRDEMFTFSDLVMLDDTNIRILFQALDKDTWLLGLRGADESVKELVFRNLSDRARKLFLEDMESLGAQRISDVKGAQNKILEMARKLEESGKIIIERGERKVV
ncbi:MAG: flagellar motor switch protein FliG [Oligoflexus sp.]